MSTRCFTYTAFGLKIASDKPVFEFEPELHGGYPDVVIRWRTDAYLFPEYTENNWRFEIDHHQALLCFKGVGAFHITDTATIMVHPEQNADPRTVERYLSGVVLAVLLHLRGFVVYHAASVAWNDNGVIAFIGDSGAGKSTLAALLHLRGLSCVTDDVTAVSIDGHSMCVMPSYPKMKISPQLILEQRIPADLLCPIHADEEEKYLSLAPNFSMGPKTLRALFFLGIGTESSVRKLTSREAMIGTIRHTLPSRLLQQAGSRDHFQKCSAIAGAVPAYLLTRRQERGEQDKQWVDMVMNTLLANHGKES